MTISQAWMMLGAETRALGSRSAGQQTKTSGAVSVLGGSGYGLTNGNLLCGQQRGARPTQVVSGQHQGLF